MSITLTDERRRELENKRSPAIMARHALEPQNLSEAMQFAQMLARSTMVPKDFIGKPENCLVAIQWGREVGLGPLQALQNIAVINGRPSIWGDAALALVKSHPDCLDVIETIEGDGDTMVARCEVRRRGAQAVVQTFSVADAKGAGLWGKQGPWQQYKKRMLQMRARGFAIRDAFPDALRGMVTTEEAQDTFTGVTLDNDTVPQPRATYKEPLPADVAADSIPSLEEPPPPPTQGDKEARWAMKVQAQLDAADDEETIHRIRNRLDVESAFEKALPATVDALNRMFQQSLARFAEPVTVEG